MIEDASPGIRIQRTRPYDAERVAGFISRALSQERQVTPEEVVGYLGRAGLLLAEANGQLVGLLGWQVENLVARVIDFLILPARFRFTAGRVLLAAMEDMAYELQCEAVILLVHPSAVPGAPAFWDELGYGVRDIANLPSPWQEAAQEAQFALEDQVLIKQLREDQVLRPL